MRAVQTRSLGTSFLGLDVVWAEFKVIVAKGPHELYRRATTAMVTTLVLLRMSYMEDTAAGQ